MLLLFARLSIFTQLSVAIYATDREIHHAILGKTIVFTVSAAVHLKFGFLSEL